jgi:catechol 2,3-dioxygenase-like lactoylglutathione lyase family enzyme
MQDGSSILQTPLGTQRSTAPSNEACDLLANVEPLIAPGESHPWHIRSRQHPSSATGHRETELPCTIKEADMGADEVRSNGAAGAARVDTRLEIIVIPVSDVDRAKEFYTNLGWRLDADFDNGKDFRVIQVTPPGSGCSVIFGRNVTAAAPGSAQGLYLIVSDIAAARNEFLSRGVQVSDVFHNEGVYTGPDEPYLFGRARVNGPDPQRGSYRSFASFHDPDGNGWLFQEITTRLPGRIDSTATSFSSAGDLATALRRAAAAHGEHEKRAGGKHDENWPDWYAAYMVAEQSGEKLPE